MAVILVLAGSLAGFLAAFAGLVFGDMAPLAALGLWSAMGLGPTVLLIGLTALPRRRNRRVADANRQFEAFFP